MSLISKQALAACKDLWWTDLIKHIVTNVSLSSRALLLLCQYPLKLPVDFCHLVSAVSAGRLSRIQQRVLQEVSERLPPEMRILDMVLRLLTRSERMNTLRLAATGQGGEAVPSCEIRRVQGAALQLVSDMEEKDAIPDRYKFSSQACSFST